jgi:hypothetical protein
MKTTTEAVPQVLAFDSLDLATCSVSELEATFARARAAVSVATSSAARAQARTQTLSFVSLIGR